MAGGAQTSASQHAAGARRPRTPSAGSSPVAPAAQNAAGTLAGLQIQAALAACLKRLAAAAVHCLQASGLSQDESYVQHPIWQLPLRMSSGCIACVADAKFTELYDDLRFGRAHDMCRYCCSSCRWC